MLKTCITILISLVAVNGHTITRVGNGGDVVYCDEGGEFSGYYSYDFLATYNLKTKNQDVVKVSSIEASLARLYKVVARILPNQLQAFRQFVRHIGNYDDQQATHFWQQRPGSLIDVPNLPHLRDLPENCQSIHQAVIHYNLGDQQIYEINTPIVEALKERPLQWSFLLVHEFLWGVFTQHPASAVEAQKRFEFTRFLHSRAAQEWNELSVFQHLSNLGVAPSSQIFSEYLTWGEKYNPPETRRYHCTIQDWVGDSSGFILEFSGLAYLGSSGGYFYDRVGILDPTSFEKMDELLRRVGDIENIYVFKSGFNFSLMSSNPLDGSIENNLSSVLTLGVPRGQGTCMEL